MTNVRSKTTKSKKSRRRYYRRRKKNKVSLSKAPLPMRLFNKMRYVTWDKLSLQSAGIVDTLIISGNDLYDPDRTNAGHQPRGFDQLITMYDHFVVLGSKIRVMFTSTANDTNDNCIIGIALKDTATPYSDPNEYQEGRTCRWTTMRSFARDPKCLTLTASTKKFLGRPHVLSEDSLQGSSNTSPNEGMFFHIFVANIDTSVTPVTNILVNVSIEYLVCWREPRQPSQS